MKRLIIFRPAAYGQDNQIMPFAAKVLFARTKFFHEIVGQVDLVLTSPIVRAAQTAIVIAKAMQSSNIQTEGLLTESYSGGKELIQETVITYADFFKCQTVVVVTHYPNIKQIFGIGLDLGAEIILEAQTWDSIFDKRPTNLLSLINNPDEELLQRYFYPKCTVEDLQKLKEIDFLQDKI